ncbi:ATP-dependent nuclease [Paramagnetospirillum magneticum]|uniref:ATP-dependent nuclease n=1 Tax=Paramagnetospirillum magneticum TaxID=84159 RepID=UPI0013051D25|nr:ATP-binding protein [Paramagnetospirillum magneticum]
MKLEKIIIKGFKKIHRLELSLEDINLLIGGNNSGKSSTLQAVHAAVTAAQSQLEFGNTQTVSEQKLRYSPTGDYSQLGHKSPFGNRADQNRAEIQFIGKSSSGDAAEYTIELYKGRNEGNVGISRSGTYPNYGANICRVAPPFTVYVPGLAGVPHQEEFKTEAVVLRKMAGGEANFVLRNILLMLSKQGKLPELTGLLEKLFGPIDIDVTFRPERDHHISVKVSVGSGEYPVPLDLVGTGLLQAIQIFAYVTLFSPALLLLDEPDSHLHPSNQSMLMQAFRIIASNFDTKILIATHSRHLILSAPEDAKCFWLDGGMLRNEREYEAIDLLTELGALDDADKVLNSQKEFLFIVEDENPDILKFLLQNIGIGRERYDIVPYYGTSHAEAIAKTLKKLKRLIRGNRNLILHRDRDFMTDAEVETWKRKVGVPGVTIFVTQGSDLEHYLINANHLSSISGLNVDIVSNLIDTLLSEGDGKIRKSFKNKRKSVNHDLHEDGGGPLTDDLCPPDQNVCLDHVIGKFFEIAVKNESERITGKKIIPRSQSGVVLAPDLKILLEALRG